MISGIVSRSIIGWSARLVRPILTIPCFQEILRIVRIPLPLLQATRARLGVMQKPNVLTPKRDAKDDSILAARREMQRRRRHAPSCMETTEVSGNSQEVRYSQGKASFCSGGQGIRTLDSFQSKIPFCFSRNAKYDARRIGGSNPTRFGPQHSSDYPPTNRYVPVLLGPTNLIWPASRNSSSSRLTVFRLHPNSVAMSKDRRQPVSRSSDKISSRRLGGNASTWLSFGFASRASRTVIHLLKR